MNKYEILNDITYNILECRFPENIYNKKFTLEIINEKLYIDFLYPNILTGFFDTKDIKYSYYFGITSNSAIRSYNKITNSFIVYFLINNKKYFNEFFTESTDDLNKLINSFKDFMEKCNIEYIGNLSFI